MKKIIAISAALLLLSGAAVSAEEPADPPIVLSELTTEEAGEKPVLLDIEITDTKDARYLVKYYETPPEYDPELLKEDSFEKNGYQYAAGEVLRTQKNYESETRVACQTVTLPCGSREEAAGKFAPILDYAMDGFSGQLELDRESIRTEAADSRTYSYTVTDTKEFTGLPRNDSSYIPKTAVKNGVNLTLTDISWQPMGGGMYNAVATYSGSASGTKPTGYLTTAVYTGEVSKNVLSSVTYKVIYEGTPIPAGPYDWTPWLLLGGAVLSFLLLATILWRFRRNARLYAMQMDGRYKLLRRYRVRNEDPLVDLGSPFARQYQDFLVTVDQAAGRKLSGSQLRVLLGDGNYVTRMLNWNGGVCGVRFHVDWPGAQTEEEDGETE